MLWFKLYKRICFILLSKNFFGVVWYSRRSFVLSQKLLGIRILVQIQFCQVYFIVRVFYIIKKLRLIRNDLGLEIDKGYYFRVEDFGIILKMYIIIENYKNLYKILDDWIYFFLFFNFFSFILDFFEVLCLVQILKVRNFYFKNLEQWVYCILYRYVGIEFIIFLII